MKASSILITVSTVLVFVILLAQCQPSVKPPIDTAAVATFVYHNQPTLRTQTFDIEVSRPGFVRPLANGPYLKGIPTQFKKDTNYTSAYPQCRYNMKNDRYSIITYSHNKTTNLNVHSLLFYNAYSNSTAGLIKPTKILLPLISDNRIYSHEFIGPDKSLVHLWLMTCVNSSVPQSICMDSYGVSYYRPDLYIFNYNTGALSYSSYVPEPGKLDSRKLPKYNLILGAYSSAYYAPDATTGDQEFMLIQSASGNNHPSSTQSPKSGEIVLISFRYDYSKNANSKAYRTDFYNLGNLGLKQFVVASGFRVYGIIRDPKSSDVYNSELRIADFPSIKERYYPAVVPDFFALNPRLDLSAYTDFHSMTFSWWNSQIVVLATKRSTGTGVKPTRVVLFIDVKKWDQAETYDTPILHEYRYSTIDNSNNDFAFTCVAVNKSDKSRIY